MESPTATAHPPGSFAVAIGLSFIVMLSGALVALASVHDGYHSCFTRGVPDGALQEDGTVPGFELGLLPLGVVCAWEPTRGGAVITTHPDWMPTFVVFGGALAFTACCIGQSAIGRNERRRSAHTR